MGVEKRTERSILAILRDTANHHMKSMEKLGYKDLIDQFHNEAFAAFNAACNGLTPELLCFVTRLACASLPNPGRTWEERHSGRMARQHHWRLLVIPIDPIGSRNPKSIDLMDEVFIFAGCRFMKIDRDLRKGLQQVSRKNRPLHAMHHSAMELRIMLLQRIPRWPRRGVTPGWCENLQGCRTSQSP